MCVNYKSGNCNMGIKVKPEKSTELEAVKTGPLTLRIRKKPS